MYLFFESSYFTSWIINLHFRGRKHPFLNARIFCDFINLFTVKAFHCKKNNSETFSTTVFNLSGGLRLRNYRAVEVNHKFCSWFSIFACFCGSHSNIRLAGFVFVKSPIDYKWFERSLNEVNICYNRICYALSKIGYDRIIVLILRWSSVFRRKRKRSEDSNEQNMAVYGRLIILGLRLTHYASFNALWLV